ncbi:MAG TPA: winged helix-turn-helix domain-containing protein [Pseudolabrys sp.]
MKRAQSDGSAGQIAFGPFVLDPGKRLLSKSGFPVEIGGRALDLLVVLAENPGRVVTKRELIKRIWPDVVVEDSSLRFHIAMLRRILGDGEDGARYLNTQTGVGYAFVCDTSPSAFVNKAASSGGFTPKPAAIRSLPPRSNIIGREDDAQLILERLRVPCLITISGPGGVGKTTIAVEMAHRVAAAAEGIHVRFVDLAAVADSSLVSSTIAGTLGISVHADDPAVVLIPHLRTQAYLIVIDNCEHVIDSVCAIAERIRDEAPNVRLLATSREPLRARHEQVYWLDALRCPSDIADLSIDALLEYPAISLFVQRATASSATFEVKAQDVGQIAEICGRLEGMALPIELAATRAATHGVLATSELLGKQLSLGWRGRRTATARQQTMEATFDWSFDLLSPLERRVFERLSAFRGPFSIDAAAYVVCDERTGNSAAIAALEALCAKSLVALDRSETPGLYRLLELTRVYAREKHALSGNDEVAKTNARHAEYYLRALEKAVRSPMTAAEDVAGLAGQLGNVRSALEWSFGPNGEVGLAIPLAAASVPLFLWLSQLVECRTWCALAVERLGADFVGSAKEMELQAALALTLMFTRGNIQLVESALHRAFEIAVSLDDNWNQLRLLGRMQIFYERIGEFEKSLLWARRAVDVAKTIDEPEAAAVAASLSGVSLHLLGDQPGARRELELSLELHPAANRARTLFYGFDHRNRTLTALGRTLWLQGHVDDARRLADQTESEATALSHPVSQCIALLWTLSVHMWVGDYERASSTLRNFAEIAERNALGPYITASQGLWAALDIQFGCAEEAVATIEECLKKLRIARYELLTTSLEIALTEGLLIMGDSKLALERVNGAIARCRKKGDGFSMPELLRLKAKALKLRGEDDVAIDAILAESLTCAASQGARAWEMRTSLDLARALMERGDSTKAVQLLETLHSGAATENGTVHSRELMTLWSAAQSMPAAPASTSQVLK